MAKVGGIAMCCSCCAVLNLHEVLESTLKAVSQKLSPEAHSCLLWSPRLAMLLQEAMAQRVQHVEQEAGAEELDRLARLRELRELRQRLVASASA